MSLEASRKVKEEYSGAGYVHPTAIIAEGAQVAPDVKIGPYCVIGENVKLASGNELVSHVVLDGFTEIGKNNKIFPFAALGFQPQDLKFGGEASQVIIGENNSIREYVTIHPGTSQGRMKTSVGNSNLLMANSHVGHDCIVGDNNVLANSAALAGHVTIGDSCILGGLVGIHQFSHIGDFAFLGGGSMVSQDIPPYVIAQGDRASLRGVNKIGLQRAGFSDEEISKIKLCFRKIFLQPGSFKKNLDEVLGEYRKGGNEGSLRLNTFLDFIQQSVAKTGSFSRGVCPVKKSSTNEE